MKVIHICGESGVGKNHLISKLIGISNEQLASRYDLEECLFAKFEIEEPFQRIGPVSDGGGNYQSLDYLGLKENYENLVKEDKNKILIHQWQHKSNELITHIEEFNKADGANVSQKIFIMWRCPWEHRKTLLEKRSNTKYIGWTEIKLRRRFVTCVHDILKQKMKADGKDDTGNLNQIDCKEVLALLKEHEIEVITPIAHMQYTSIDDHNLLFLLEGKKNQYEPRPNS
ncbi:hypothetical protein FYZ48_10845 [Gimesia chilikensis]|uniref:hypothetical protein n=1 Tax=Gimesia chilikensis TaxID=2605989 RepID=UPI0011EFDCFE|nr:hypothetical protein [Gimesia chilikensis]KAA0139134.1 hypothetical protein FYZ48_10845 [Gimesia chilikensis]